MRHLFIVNPAAGKKTDPMELSSGIAAVMEKLGFEYEIYLTTGPMDAARKISEAAQEHEALRIYACGGDGTLNECVNGAAGHANVELTHYPAGTGNDFLKIFGSGAERFRDLEALATGESRELDLIDCNGRLSINICSVGMDARVGTDVHKYSGLPLVHGKGAYIVSLLVNFFKGICQHYRLTADGLDEDDSYAVICACNGRYYGGGFNPMPEAMPDNGIFDVLVIRRVSRLTFLRLVGKYAAGRWRELGDYLQHYSLTDFTIEADEPIPVNIDGERLDAAKIHFSLSDKKLRFFFPAGCSYDPEEQKKIAVN